MTDDPAVTLARAAIDTWRNNYDAEDMHGPSLDATIVAAFRTTEGARALFPELAEAVDAWKAASLAAAQPIDQPRDIDLDDAFDEAEERLCHAAFRVFTPTEEAGQ